VEVERPGGSKNNSIVLNIALAAVFLGTLAYLTIRFGPEFTRLVADPGKFREYLLSFGPWSAVIFFLFQILQVVIAVIPGEPIQIAGGYIFGTIGGTALSVLGITTGYILVFLMVRIFGFPLVKKLVPEKDHQKFISLLNNPKMEATIFLLFLIPGIPKDVLVYIAALTPIKPLLFFVIVILARLPALIGSAFIGARIESGDFSVVIIVSIVAVILFVLGFIFQKKLIDFVQKHFHKNDGKPKE
jgi:uncharacterized membrane protein YdjX (TVP38/TMEM64 family)